jgi:hypothetical protein
MDEKTAKRVIEVMKNSPSLKVMDLTGGAPELNLHFKYMVQEGRNHNLEVIDRCNLTVFYEEGMNDLPQFLADNKVQVVASLPCVTVENVDKQR